MNRGEYLVLLLRVWLIARFAILGISATMINSCARNANVRMILSIRYNNKAKS